MKKIGIYKIVSPSQRIYIGKSKNIERRFKEYFRLQNCKQQIRLHRSFLKHGVDFHIFEILEECEIEKLNERERYWQDFYDVLNGGLNCHLTPTEEVSQITSKETLEKMRKSATGRKASIDTKNKLSKIRTGEKNSFFGKTHKEYSKKLMSDKKTGLNNVRSKIVICVETGIFFYSIKEAAEAYNMKEITLYFQLKGLNKNKTNLIIV